MEGILAEAARRAGLTPLSSRLRGKNLPPYAGEWMEHDGRAEVLTLMVFYYRERAAAGQYASVREQIYFMTHGPLQPAPHARRCGMRSPGMRRRKAAGDGHA
jgi:hypothetical protein